MIRQQLDRPPIISFSLIQSDVMLVSLWIIVAKT